MFQSSLLTPNCWALVLGSKTLNSSGGQPPPGSTMHMICSPMGACLPLLHHPGKPRVKHDMHLHSLQGCLRALLAFCLFGMGTFVQMEAWVTISVWVNRTKQKTRTFPRHTQHLLLLVNIQTNSCKS